MSRTAHTTPDRAECLALMEAHGMLTNIRRHSLIVCEVSLKIARALNAGGSSHDLQEIEAAALLHDITKTRSLETGENHARSGAELLRGLGFSRVADIVREHITPRDQGLGVSPAEIVSYADKRVLHDRIVSLTERFDYLFERYGRNSEAIERIRSARERTRAVEQKILAHLRPGTLDLDSFQTP